MGGRGCWGEVAYVSTSQRQPDLGDNLHTYLASMPALLVWAGPGGLDLGLCLPAHGGSNGR